MLGIVKENKSILIHDSINCFPVLAELFRHSVCGVSVKKGGDPLEFCQHLIHLVGVYLVGQPCHAVACDVLTELIDESFRPSTIP